MLTCCMTFDSRGAGYNAGPLSLQFQKTEGIKVRGKNNLAVAGESKIEKCLGRVYLDWLGLNALNFQREREEQRNLIFVGPRLIFNFNLLIHFPKSDSR